MIRRGALIALMLSMILMTPGIARADVTAVLDDPQADETQPAVSHGYLVWTQRNTSFVRADGEQRIRMNPAGTSSFAASIDGTTAVFHQVVHRQGDLFMFDVPTQTISDPPAGVNTSASESEPSISGDWLLFTRTSDPRVNVILFNPTTLEERVVADLRARRHYLISDQVNGDWATWESCDVRRFVYSNCEAFRYQISGGTVEMLSNPGRQQYAAGVTTDGTAYAIRTGRSAAWRCGAGARIVRIDPNGDSQVIAALPKGMDSFNTFAFEESDGSTTLYFERLLCPPDFHSDIFKIGNADTA